MDAKATAAKAGKGISKPAPRQPSPSRTADKVVFRTSLRLFDILSALAEKSRRSANTEFVTALESYLNDCQRLPLTIALLRLQLGTKQSEDALASVALLEEEGFSQEKEITFRLEAGQREGALNRRGQGDDESSAMSMQRVLHRAVIRWVNLNAQVDALLDACLNQEATGHLLKGFSLSPAP